MVRYHGFENPRDQWQRMLGQRLGRRPAPRVTYHGNMQANRPARVRRIARGQPGIPARITRSYNRQTGGGRGARSSGYTAPAVADAWQNVYDDLINRYQETANEQVAVNRANEEEASRDYPWYQDVMNAVTGLGGDDSGFSSSIIGRGLDVLSRPAYGIFEGLESLAGQETHRGYSPEDLAFSFGNFFSGLGRGLTGKDKTGFGQVYESLQENPTSSAGRMLNAFEEAHPALEQATSQAVGLGGELFLDPLNFLTPSAPNILRETGEEATEAVLRDSLGRLVGEATDEFAANSGLIRNAPVYANHPELLTERLITNLGQNVDNAIVNVAGGGNRAVRLMNDQYWPTTVANQATAEITEAMTEGFRRAVDNFWTQGQAGRLTPASVTAYRRVYNDFDEFFTALENKFPTATVDDILDMVQDGRITRRAVDELVQESVSKYASALERTYTEIFEGARNPTYRTVGLRIGNKNVPFRPIGRAYDFARTKLDGATVRGRHIPGFPNHGTLFRNTFEGTFPGTFALKLERARALSMNTMDAFRKRMEDMARQFTADEGRELMQHLENGLPLAGKSVRSGADKAGTLAELRQILDDIILDEYTSGARSRNSVRGDNYTYIFNRGGHKKARADFKRNRKAAFNDPARRGAGEFTIQKAKDLGLNPVDDAFRSVYYRKIKSARDTVRATFLSDLVENYAIHAGDPVLRLPEKAIRDRGLVEISASLLPDHLRAAMKAKKGRFYLPKPIWEMYKKFEELSGWTSAEWGVMGRAFARVISMLKKGLTIPYPGFHMKNMIGDVFMGLLDDVNPDDYARVINQRMAKLAGRKGRFRIVPGLEFTYDGMMTEYMRNADAGFFKMEMDSVDSFTAGRMPRRIGRGIADTATKLADKREKFPRFVHFVTAYQDEAQALWKSGVRDLDVIMKKASDAAIWRVNNFKFDYAALMPFEKKIKTAAFPFYTYLRKALPVLLQQMYLNPHYFSAADRFMQYNDGSAADGFNEDNIPQWIRDIGFGMITDEEEPWAVTADLLPLGALDILGSGSVGELSQNVLSNLNPLLQAPIELSTKRELFSGRPIGDTSTFEYLMQNLPMLQDVQEELGVDVPGLPGYVGDPVWEQLTSPEVLHNRLAGIGLPIRQISTQQQEQQQNANVDRLIEDPIQDFNYSQDRYRITVTDDFQYRITDQITGVVLGTVPTPQAAIEFAQRQAGSSYNQPYTSPYRPPSSADVQAILDEMMQG